LLLVHVVGLGMSVADLTPRALEIIREAQVLVGGRRLLGYFPDHPAGKIVLGKEPERALRQIPELAATRRVVVLASGDPNFYGVGPLVVKLMGAGNVVLHPNITAVQAACARLQISWQDARVISLHGRGLEPLDEALRQSRKLVIYTDPVNSPEAIAKFFLERSLGHLEFWVLEDLGQPTERVSCLSPEQAAGKKFSPLNMVVVRGDAQGREEAKPPQAILHLGLPEEALVHEAGLVTKLEVRAVVLAKLELHPGQVLWDVGAGCGSVGLEASLLLPGGRIYAVERNPDRAAQIRQNREKFGVSNLEVVEGEAPECLGGLAVPQRIFVGGGGGRLAEILNVATARLEPGGKLAIAAALLESLETARRALDKSGWEAEIVHLQVNRSRPLAGGDYLFALNPVWIIAGRKP
jgi:precorrin-6Y C5,15-methyltransferase (decarboxylating)